MKDILSNFQAVDIFILTNDETVLLRKTIEKIKNCKDYSDISKIVIVAKNHTCNGFAEASKIIEDDSLGKISLYVQKSAKVETCISEIPPMIESSHFVIMAADMETDPDNITDFIKMAKLHPEAIICAAKWLKGSVVEGYGKIHELGSRAMNAFVSMIFNSKAKDPFFIYQIYPLSVYNKLKFDDSSNFVYEHTIKALHNGIEYYEIPTVYKKRTEGKSHVTAVRMIKLALSFCVSAIKVRLSKRISEDNITVKQ